MICIIYSTFPNKEIALKIGQDLLNMKLIACSNITPLTSQYIWKEKYYEEEEFGVSFKTNSYNKQTVIKYIQKEHPFEIPYISSADHVINNAYQNWMDSFLAHY